MAAVKTTKLEAPKLTNRSMLIHIMILGQVNKYLSDPRTDPSQRQKRLGASTRAALQLNYQQPLQQPRTFLGTSNEPLL